MTAPLVFLGIGCVLAVTFYFVVILPERRMRELQAKATEMDATKIFPGRTTIPVTRCQRCGCDHDLIIEPLKNPVDEWSHWGLCAATKQPVLVMFTETKEAALP